MAPSILATLLLGALGTASPGTGVVGAEAASGAVGGVLVAHDQALEAPAATGWVAREADNIVGLRDPRTLSNPVKVDYSSLLDETPEMKRIRRERIDPTSPQGIQLKNRARQRVADACEEVMQEQGYCSVWKAIRHTDGRSVTDATDAILQRL